MNNHQFQVPQVSTIHRVLALAALLLCQTMVLANAQSEHLDIPPVLDAKGNEIPGSLVSLEKITLGDVDQWLLIRAHNTANPVLLILHGGPGGAQMPWVDLFQPPELEKNFVVVHWDQRGAGKSFDPELGVDDLQIDDYVNDTLELTDWLRARFNQPKIFLTGHSWGSALGFFTLMENSEPYHAYIPTSERVHWIRSHSESFAWVKAQAQQAGDTEVLDLISSIEPFDATNEEHLALIYQGQEIFRGGDIYTEGLWEHFLDYAVTGKSPYYTQAEVASFRLGLEKSAEAIADSIGDYDLFSNFTTATLPIHFVMGEHDHNTSADLAREYYEMLEAPSKSFTVIEGSGHSFMYEKPEAWAKVLIDIRNQTLSQ